MIATAAPSSKYTIAPKTTTKITSSTKKCHVNVKYKHSSLCLTAEFCRRCRVTCTKKVLPIWFHFDEKHAVLWTWRNFWQRHPVSWNHLNVQKVNDWVKEYTILVSFGNFHLESLFTYTKLIYCLPGCYIWLRWLFLIISE